MKSKQINHIYIYIWRHFWVKTELHQRSKGRRNCRAAALTCSCLSNSWSSTFHHDWQQLCFAVMAHSAQLCLVDFFCFLVFSLLSAAEGELGLSLCAWVLCCVAFADTQTKTLLHDSSEAWLTTGECCYTLRSKQLDWLQIESWSLTEMSRTPASKTARIDLLTFHPQLDMSICRKLIGCKQLYCLFTWQKDQRSSGEV